MGLSHSRAAASCLTALLLTVASARTNIFATGSRLPPRSFALSTKTSAAFVSQQSTLDVSLLITLRGGEEASTTSTASDVDLASATTTTTESEDEPSLDDKVFAAMKKLGMSPPSSEKGAAENSAAECENGVCTMPSSSPPQPTVKQDPRELSNRIAQDMEVDASLSMAALGATVSVVDGERQYNEAAARAMIQQELALIGAIPEDSENVQTLVEEGFDNFFVRRALAFAENNLEDARAILLADQMDEEEDEQQQQQASSPDFVEIKADFDPTKLPTTPTATVDAPTASAGATDGMPKPVPKESVVFEATTAQLQELVLESPVPVLLDVYADWCGPCKVLGPALEEMAIKSGGMFRLVKVNSDNERPVSQALEVTALPTVFGIRDGKIVHMFQGMPRSEDMMKNFMMGLFGAAPFSPPITAQETEKYKELTIKLIKAASAASFSFSARERLTDRITTKLDSLVQDESVPDVEGCANLIRTFLNNIIKNPYDEKYRKINLENKVVAAKIGGNTSSLAVLKSVGFAKSDTEMVLGKGKKIINVAPLVVARDCIDKWIQRNRAEMAAAARKRNDEQDRARLLAEKETEPEPEEEVDETVEVDPNACTLKVRLDGKKQVHDAVLSKDDPLQKVLEVINVVTDDEIQLTCVAKKLVVKSSDDEAMSKSLEDHGLMPTAAIVVKIGTSSSASSSVSSSSLKERAAEKKQKKGSHTMQSIGIYAKDDNNKAELIDGGGGVWYEHDITDDEADVDDAQDEDPRNCVNGNDEKDPISGNDDDDEDDEAIFDDAGEDNSQ